MTHYISANPIAFISGMGTSEIIVIFLVILILFGPRKLPSIAKMIGKTLDQLRNASQDFKDEIMKIEDDVKDDFKAATMDAIDIPVVDDLDGTPDDGEDVDANSEDSKEIEEGEREKEPAG
jgi:sec-independent protein translocase protein TatA